MYSYTRAVVNAVKRGVLSHSTSATPELLLSVNTAISPRISPYRAFTTHPPGPVAQSIVSSLSSLTRDATGHVTVRDDSHKHAGHAAMKGLKPQETHFHITIVSPEFEGKSLIQRHRLVYGLLQQQIQDGVHAIQLTTLTPSEKK